MNTVEVYIKDLKDEKAKEVLKFFDGAATPDSLIMKIHEVPVQRKEDLDVDVEETRIKLDLDDVEVH